MMPRCFALALACLLWLNNVSFAQQLPGSQCVSQAVAGGTADALTIPQLPCTATSTLLVLNVTATNATTTPTLQQIGVSAPQVILYGATGGALSAGQLAAGSQVILTYNGVNWFLLTTASASISGPASSVAGDSVIWSDTHGKALADGGLPAINVKGSPYFAKGDGTTDDTTAIATAAAVAGTNPLYFPAGRYEICGLASQPQFNWQGAGPNISILQAKSGCGSTTLISLGQASGTSISTGNQFSGLTVDCQGGCSNAAVQARNINSSTFTNSSFINTSGIGFLSASATSSVSAYNNFNRYVGLQAGNNNGPGFEWTGEKYGFYDQIISNGNGSSLSNGVVWTDYTSDSIACAAAGYGTLTGCGNTGNEENTVGSVIVQENGGQGIIVDSGLRMRFASLFNFSLVGTYGMYLQNSQVGCGRVSATGTTHSNGTLDGLSINPQTAYGTLYPSGVLNFFVTGANSLGIPAGTTVQATPSSSSVTLNQNANASATGSVTFTADPFCAHMNDVSVGQLETRGVLNGPLTVASSSVMANADFGLVKFSGGGGTTGQIGVNLLGVQHSHFGRVLLVGWPGPGVNIDQNTDVGPNNQSSQIQFDSIDLDQTGATGTSNGNGLVVGSQSSLIQVGNFQANGPFMDGTNGDGIVVASGAQLDVAHAQITPAGTSGLVVGSALTHILNLNGAEWIPNGNSPTIAGGACGTNPSISGSLKFATLTVGTGNPATCTVTWPTTPGITYKTAARCTPTSRSQLAFYYTVATNQLVISQKSAVDLSGTVIDFQCSGY